MKKKLYIMSGAAGSGKSTWIREHAHLVGDKTVTVVSRDEIRFSLVKENEDYFSKEKQVYAAYIESIKSGLANSDCVFCDATHLNESSRRKLFNALGSALKDVDIVAIVIKASLGVALSQNERRRGTRGYVPEKAIRNMLESFSMPSIDEGFTTIYIYEEGRLVSMKVKG